MSILLSLVLAQAKVLPQVDRRALEQQARAEAVQARQKPVKVAGVTAAAAAARPVSRRLAQRDQPAAARPAATRPAPVRQAAARTVAVRQASSSTMDLSEITGICRAASNQADAASFLSSLARVRSLSEAQGASLRISCAAYQAGRADARATSQGTPGL